MATGRLSVTTAGRYDFCLGY